MPADYRFLDEWRLAAGLDRVYDLVGHPLDYPRWWSDVFLEADGDGGDPEPGKQVGVVARGFLPYRLHFTLTTLEATRPHRIHSRLDGDFEGTGTWLLEADGDGTRVALDWRPAVRKAGVRQLTPVLRPLFRANHAWTMRRGLAAAEREFSAPAAAPSLDS